MQRIYFLIFFILGHAAFSQSTGVGVGTVNPHPSAEFEINSSSRGFLPPRMTYIQRNSIINPAQGLIIYCNNCDTSGQVQIYNGIKWTNLLGGTALKPLPANLPSVTIGTQIWQSKNLDLTTYSNGDPIPQVTNASQWSNLTNGAWCWYNNDSVTYAAVYGRLYNWYAVADSRGLCPNGWHVPSDTEWTQLADFLGGRFLAGGALKAITNWNSPNSGATNSSGFTGLPGGYRGDNGSFVNLGNVGYFWGSTEYPNYVGGAYCRYLYYSNSNIDRSFNNKPNGISVRCIKD